MTHHHHSAAVAARVPERTDRQDDTVLRQFVTLFWSKSPETEQAGRSAENDLLLSVDCCRRLDARSPSGVEVCVDNPATHGVGWSSERTVIRVFAPDMPFVIDSLLMALSQAGHSPLFLNNVVFRITRDANGKVENLTIDRNVSLDPRELVALVEVDRIDDSQLQRLREQIQGALADVRAAVTDFPAMRARLQAGIERLEQEESTAQTREAIDFLRWLGDNHFTFLGYREFRYSDDTMQQVPGSALGILRERGVASVRKLSEQTESAKAFLLEPVLLSFSKSGTLSRVHRPAYPDYVGLREIDSHGKVVGEWGFLGLYTSRVYLEHPATIPTVRNKVANIIQRSGLNPSGFDGKVLAQVLATWPRDELMQIDEAALFEQAMAVTFLHERRRTRVFTRHDRYGLFVTCLVYLPRDLYNTRVREKIEAQLLDAFAATHASFEPSFSESALVRLHFTLRINPGGEKIVDPDTLESLIGNQVQDWTAQLTEAMRARHGESTGRSLTTRYAPAFAASYREEHTADTAATDIDSIRELSPERPLVTRLWRGPSDLPRTFHVRLFHLTDALPLSDIIPALENLGLRVLTENSHELRCGEPGVVHLQDLVVEYGAEIDLERCAGRFADALAAIWHGDAENDRFNQLLFAADLDTRWIGVLRAYARYNEQLRFGFSLNFVADTLAKHAPATRILRDLFDLRFDPALTRTSPADLEASFNGYADSVSVLNEDRALRRLLELILATDRTNFYQPGRRVLAMKIAPQRINGVPMPVPAHEIFVSAPHVEGVHLRGGPIARGGLRWSDRLEDYRTEVLGLVKAQTVKNAVIVPGGAKGGFVVKGRQTGDRLANGKRCYADFVGALLDLTDNLVEGRVVHPDGVRCHDGDDPYLVVAADKGTATFSDLANSIAQARHFWLGDAFASGGSNGYDHKKIGITAKGAWISVARHFRELGIDVAADPVTVLGIGDMSGDVFGNGMLLSRAIRLVAAFDHRHVFIDPDPDPEVAFRERERLFALPRSSWADYDAALISRGGGVFSRDTKSVPVTTAMRERFGFEADTLSPDELIHALLKAPVDLIWNGGIGTWVKASSEPHDAANDRANDSLRVDASDLRCRAIGEGGNLGITQAGRIEFSLRGGRINTDFIDNSAGVDCSDHEVNLKILLNERVRCGEITLAHRNLLLEEMTGEIASLVLASNTQQTLVLSLAEHHQQGRTDEYRRCIQALERNMDLNRALEGLPDDATLLDRARTGSALTRPELAVLLAWGKMFIKRELMASDFPADPAARELLLAAFPSMTASQFGPALDRHRLRAEIIATQAANQLVYHLGITSPLHLREMVGGTVAEVARSFFAASHCLSLRNHRRAIEESSAPEAVRMEMRLELLKQARHATRWLLRNRRDCSGIAELAGEFLPVMRALESHRVLLSGINRTEAQAARMAAWEARGVSRALIARTLDAVAMVTGFSLGDAAARERLDVTTLAQHYADLGNGLALYELCARLMALQPDSHWQAMERDILVEDVALQQSRLAARVVKSGMTTADWLRSQGALRESWRAVMADLALPGNNHFACLSMTCRKLQDLWT
jgi:glutamate dehydrogenase